MMHPDEFKKYKVTKRPYPQDMERRLKVKQVMLQNGIETVAALSKKLKINYNVLTEIINGTRRSAVTEERIARFFKMPVTELFPLRSKFDLAEMNKAQQSRGNAA